MEERKNIDDFSVVFMGTPGFAVKALEKLYNNGIRISAVVTAVDKPSGRGQKMNISEVKQFALSKNLPLLQPEKLKDPVFIEKLKNINADLFVVVAFRMLPEVVWSLPAKGTINLHASLLPQYRGAAPINRAVMSGEKETGVTTFFISHEIDTGKIIARKKTPVSEEMTAGELHDILAETGANLLLETVNAIRQGNIKPVPQEEFSAEFSELKPAPKIFREDCRINWNLPVKQVYDHIRGLSPYPGAFTELHAGENEPLNMKIYKAISCAGKGAAGKMETDNKSFIKVYTADGCLSLTDIQLAGKKRMSVEEFLRGSRLPENIVCS